MAEFSQRAEQIEQLEGRPDRGLRRRPRPPADRRRDRAPPPAGHDRHPARQDPAQPRRDDRALAPSAPAASTPVDAEEAWVASLADRNDLPLLAAGDLGEPILADAARGRRRRGRRAARHLRPAQPPRRGAPGPARRPLRLSRRAGGGRRAGHRARRLEASPASRHRSSATSPSTSAAPTARLASGRGPTSSTRPRRSSKPRRGCSRRREQVSGPRSTTAAAVGCAEAPTCPGATTGSAPTRGSRSRRSPRPERVLDVLVGPAGPAHQCTFLLNLVPLGPDQW